MKTAVGGLGLRLSLSFRATMFSVRGELTRQGDTSGKECVTCSSVVRVSESTTALGRLESKFWLWWETWPLRAVRALLTQPQV